MLLREMRICSKDENLTGAIFRKDPIALWHIPHLPLSWREFMSAESLALTSTISDLIIPLAPS